jgi:hypothetical protein
VVNRKITYNLQGVVKSNIASATRYAIGRLGIPFLKNFLRFIPGIDASVDSDDRKEDFYVEIVPAFLGFFTPHWELRTKMIDRFVASGINVRSVHAPYIDDGKVFQSTRQSSFDNVLDMTRVDSATWLCLYSHIDLFSLIAPKEQEKVLVVHPLPASPHKSTDEIIESITKNVKKALPSLKEHNITLVVENMPWLKKKHERYTTALGDAIFFDQLMNEINDDSVGVLFDWGHANSYARYMYNHGITHPEHEFTQESLSSFAYQNYFIKKLSSKIHYGHVNFNVAHVIDQKPPYFYGNFDTHSDLTELTEQEYTNYKSNIQLLNAVPKLIGITIESIPSYFNRKNRITRYKGSVEILSSMMNEPEAQ